MVLIINLVFTYCGTIGKLLIPIGDILVKYNGYYDGEKVN